MLDAHLSLASHAPSAHVRLLSPSLTPPRLSLRDDNAVCFFPALPSVRWSGFGGVATPGSGVKRRRQPDDAEDGGGGGGGGGGWGDVLLMSQRPASPVARR